MKRALRTLVIGLAVGLAAVASAGPSQFKGDAVFDHLARLSKERMWAKLPIGALVGEVGLALRGTPYVGATLEVDDHKEICVVNLEGLDCVTFYETSLGFARMLKLGKLSKKDLTDQIRVLRYRGGKQGDYTTRLHYTTDYLFDNDRRGTMALLAPKLPGAVALEKTLDYMSTHADKIRQLKANPALVPIIAAMEREATARKPMYIPKEAFAMVEPLLETGDIIGLVTTAAGLDTSHTGLLYRDSDGALRFMHATSDSRKQVVLDGRLADYLANSTKTIGIVIARPLEPRRGR